MNSLENALSLWARGMSVFPVPRPDGCHDGKKPVISWAPYQERRATDMQVRLWFRRIEQNVAIVTGKVSGVVVVDIDSAELIGWAVRHLPRTPWQVESAKGFHLYYRHPGVRVGNRARLQTLDGKLAIDVRGDGGYVIGPGSLHATGARYEYAGDWSVPREQLPVFGVDWLQPPKPAERPAPKPTPRPTGDATERARKYLAAIPRPEIGQGSDTATMYAACRLVRGFGLSEGDATSLLWEWAGNRPGWTQSWIQRKVRNSSHYGTEAVGAML